MFQMNNVQLFSKGPFNDVGSSLAGALGKTARDMAERLQNWDPDDLLNTPAEDIIERLVDQGSVRCPRLLVDDVFLLEPTEVLHEFVDFGRRLTRRVTRLVLVVPFEGEEEAGLRRC
jgi:hypothetical protein